MGCYSPFIHELEIADEFDFALITTNPGDCISSDGLLEIDGEATDFEFSIDGGLNWQKDILFEMLDAGSYEIIARSEEFPDCQKVLLAELEAPNAPVIDSVMIDPISSCLDPITSLEVFASGSNLEFSIDGGLTWQLSNQFSQLNSGMYVVQLRRTDLLNCIDETEITIESINEINITDVFVADPSDCNSSDGLILIESAGPNLEYSIDNGTTWSANNEFEDIPSGEYQVWVRSMDFHDCTDSVALELFEAIMPSIVNIESEMPSTCEPENGSLMIMAQGSNLEYSIDNGLSWSDDDNFVNLSSGAYTVIVREQGMPNCLASQEIDIIQIIDRLADPEVSIVGLSECNASDAIAEIILIEPDIEFSINGGVDWQNSNLFDNLSSGTYSVMIRKILYPECQSQIDFDIDEIECPCPGLTVSFEISSISCPGEEDGIIEIIDIEGALDMSYNINWENGVEGNLIQDLTSDWYSFEIVYNGNCNWIDSVFVNEIDPITFGLKIFDADCQESDNGQLEIIDVNGGNGAFSYSLGGLNFQESNSFFNLSPDQYEVFVSDQLGCQVSDHIAIESVQDLEIELLGTVNITYGESILLNPMINSTSIDSFLWTPTEGILNPYDLVAEVAPLITTEYTLLIFYGECVESRSIIVEVDVDFDIYTGDLFTPNGDGNNDDFYLQSKINHSLQINTFIIYDRWGNMVFEKENPELNNPDDGWNGHYNNQPVNPGVFVYYIDYNVNGQSRSIAGSLTVIR